LDLKRTHITNFSSILLDKKYSQEDRFPLKPRGLWYAIDSEWREWCFYNDFGGEEANTFELEIDLDKVLTISTIPELKLFVDEFCEEVMVSMYFIRWDKLVEKYSGIELLNYYHLKHNMYQEGLFMKCLFVSAWDVNGGCIWDLSVIKKVTKN